MFCLNICQCTTSCSACGGQKGALDLSGLELQTVVSCQARAGNCVPIWEISPVAWDTMGVVMDVGEETSAEDSTSLRVLGERMETGWVHRILCKERKEVECLSQSAATPALADSSVPFHQVMHLLGREEGTRLPEGGSKKGTYLGHCRPSHSFPADLNKKHNDSAFSCISSLLHSQ